MRVAIVYPCPLAHWHRKPLCYLPAWWLAVQGVSFRQFELYQEVASPESTTFNKIFILLVSDTITPEIRQDYEHPGAHRSFTARPPFSLQIGSDASGRLMLNNRTNIRVIKANLQEGRRGM